MCVYICLCCSCLDPMDCSPPGFPVHRITQARILVPFPSPGNLPDPGIEPLSPASAGGFFITEPPGKPIRDILFPKLTFSDKYPIWLSLYSIIMMTTPCGASNLNAPVLST